MVKPGILVVADDAALRATLARWLMQAGYAVELAESARRAHEVASKAAISVAMVAPQGIGAPGVELAHELAELVEHVIMIGEQPGNGASPGAPDAGISLPLSEPDVLAKVKAALRPAPAPMLRIAIDRLRRLVLWNRNDVCNADAIVVHGEAVRVDPRAQRECGR